MLKHHEIALGFLFATAIWLIFFLIQSNIAILPLEGFSDSIIEVTAAVVVLIIIFAARKVSLRFVRQREENENKKWNAGPYDQSTEPPIDNRTFVNEARAYRETQKSNERKREFAETAIFPGQHPALFKDLERGKSFKASHPENGYLVLVVSCFIYRTMNEVHWTQFCGLLAPPNRSNDNKWQSIFCGIDNRAN